MLGRIWWRNCGHILAGIQVSESLGDCADTFGQLVKSNINVFELYLSITLECKDCFFKGESVSGGEESSSVVELGG